MSTVKCNSCGGTYSNTLPDGSRYFHACPPDDITTHAVADKDGNVKTPEVRTERQNARNENLRFDSDKNEHVIISEGLGTTEV